MNCEETKTSPMLEIFPARQDPDYKASGTKRERNTTLWGEQRSGAERVPCRGRGGGITSYSKASGGPLMRIWRMTTHKGYKLSISAHQRKKPETDSTGTKQRGGTKGSNKRAQKVSRRIDLSERRVMRKAQMKGDGGE